MGLGLAGWFGWQAAAGQWLAGGAGILLALAFALRWRRICTPALAMVLALAAFPSLWLAVAVLLLAALAPPGEALTAGRLAARVGWAMPRGILIAAWLVLAAKLTHPTWYGPPPSASGIAMDVFLMAMLLLFLFDERLFPPALRNGGGPVVFFDSDCLLCNGTVQFLMREDMRHTLRFAPLQGSTAAQLYERHPQHKLKDDAPPSILVATDFDGDAERVDVKSTAVARILAGLGGWWRVAALVMLAIPRPLRDWGYDTIATNRYHWFGKTKEACAMPGPNDARKMLP